MRIQTNKEHRVYTTHPNMQGKLPEDELNILGKEKRTVVSFQCKNSIWKKFDRMIENKYGKYKKSSVLEEMIRRYVEKEEKKGL